jgi:hypothetical protein
VATTLAREELSEAPMLESRLDSAELTIGKSPVPVPVPVGWVRIPLEIPDTIDD